MKNKATRRRKRGTKENEIKKKRELGQKMEKGEKIGKDRGV
jgi:hypothetical protein